MHSTCLDRDCYETVIVPGQPALAQSYRDQSRSWRALYNLSRLLVQTDPAEAKTLQSRFEALQAKRHVMDRAQTLGNFALTSAAAHDWPQAIAQLKEGLTLCGDCSALPLLHKDLGLIYCRSGDLKNGLAEMLEAQKLTPNDPEIAAALQVLGHTNK